LKSSELSDSLDLVPIAGFWGKGKRKGVFGTYLLAAYCKNTDSYEAVCKLGTGFSDDFLKTSTEALMLKTIKSQPSNYIAHSNLKPDVWFEPSQV
jgi:DNA ligase-1